MTQAWDKGKIWPCYPRVLVPQWIEHPPGVQKVMGLIPVGNSGFSLFQLLELCWTVHFSHLITTLKVHHLYWISLTGTINCYSAFKQVHSDTKYSTCTCMVSTCTVVRVLSIAIFRKMTCSNLVKNNGFSTTAPFGGRGCHREKWLLLGIGVQYETLFQGCNIFFQKINMFITLYI